MFFKLISPICLHFFSVTAGSLGVTRVSCYALLGSTGPSDLLSEAPERGCQRGADTLI